MPSFGGKCRNDSGRKIPTVKPKRAYITSFSILRTRNITQPRRSPQHCPVHAQDAVQEHIMIKLWCALVLFDMSKGILVYGSDELILTPSWKRDK
jgi:hypothetical protein